MEPTSFLQDGGTSTAGAEQNPYLAARREWDDRYGALASSRRHWQVACAGTTLCSLILATGFVLLSLQHTVLPYVIHVDEHGHALTAGPIAAENGTALSGRAHRALLTWPALSAAPAASSPIARR